MRRKTPQEMEREIKAKVERTRPGFSGFVAWNVRLYEYVCAPTRDKCEEEARRAWGKEATSARWLEVKI